MAKNELDETKNLVVLSKEMINNLNLGPCKANFIFSNLSAVIVFF